MARYTRAGTIIFVGLILSACARETVKLVPEVVEVPVPGQCKELEKPPEGAFRSVEVLGEASVEALGGTNGDLWYIMKRQESALRAAKAQIDGLQEFFETDAFEP